MYSRLFFFGLFITITTYNNPSLATNQERAIRFVHDLSFQALKTLRANGKSLDQKEHKVRTLMSQNFDLELIGRYVLGAAWRKASMEHKKQYQRLFKEFVLRTYSRRFGGYAGQNFEIVGAKPIGKRDILVSSRISRPSAPPILAGWRVREKKGTYKILDIVVAGVSMVVTQRSEFRSVVSRYGVGGLVETLRMQISKFSVQNK